ncbi:MAG: hypothetical protein D6685_16235, partial [Bacteroidetes bacterium]
MRILLKASRDGDGDGFVDDGKPTMRPAVPDVSSSLKRALREAKAMRRKTRAAGGGIRNLRRVERGDIVGREKVTRRKAKALQRITDAYKGNPAGLRAAMQIDFIRSGLAHLDADERVDVIVALAGVKPGKRGRFRLTDVQAAARGLGHKVTGDRPIRVVGEERPLHADPTARRAIRSIEKLAYRGVITKAA